MSKFCTESWFHQFQTGQCTAIYDIAAYFNSDFDAYHDSPKGEVTQNVLVKSNDVSDIFKHFVDEKGVSSCLKSLWKTTLCRFILSIWPPLNPVIIVGQSLWCWSVLELSYLDLQRRLEADSPGPWVSFTIASSRASLARATRPSSPARR